MGTSRQTASAQASSSGASREESDSGSDRSNAAAAEQTTFSGTGGVGLARPSTARGGEDEEDERTIFERFCDMLEDEETDGERVLRACAWIGRNDLDTVEQVLADDHTREYTFRWVGADNMVMVALYFQVGTGRTPRHLDEAVVWIDTYGSLTDAGWARLVAGKTADECLIVLANPDSFTVVRELSGDPVTLFPALQQDPYALRQAVDNSAEYFAWIGDHGGVERQLEILAWLAQAEEAEDQRSRMVADGSWANFVKGLPDGPTLGEDGTRLWNWFLLETDLSLMMALFEKRFAVELSPENTEEYTVEAGDTLWGIAAHHYGDPTRWREIYKRNRDVIGDNPNRILPGQELSILFIHDWDHESIRRTWVIADRLPPGDVASTTLIFRYGDEGTAGGFAGGGEIGMEWGTEDLGATEVGAFTSEDDPMRGLNIFDATMRHEIGHNVGESNNFDQPGGWVYTDYGWQKHFETADARVALDAIVGAHALEFDGLTDDEADDKRDDVLDALAGVDRFNVSQFQDAVEDYESGLWDDIFDQPFIVRLRYLANTDNAAWDEMEDLGGRQYHIAYDWFGFASCPVARYSTKVSNYAMRSPMEWFAEIYATFYADADQPGGEVGSLLRSRDPAVEADFRALVHDRHNLGAVTGQTVGAPGPTT